MGLSLIKKARKLFEILNIFHSSSDLMEFRSNHIHLDDEHLDRGDRFLRFLKNDTVKTLETKSLDNDVLELNSNNTLVYSFQVPNLIDQMVILKS